MLFRIQLNLNLVLIISQLNLQGNIKTDKNKCAAIRANRVELHHSVWFLGHQIIHVWPASCIPHLLFCITEKQLIIFSASLCSDNFNPIQKGKVAEGWVTEAAPPVWPAGRFIWLVSAHSRWKLWTSAQRYSSHPLLSSFFFFFWHPQRAAVLVWSTLSWSNANCTQGQNCVVVFFCLSSTSLNQLCCLWVRRHAGSTACCVGAQWW